MMGKGVDDGWREDRGGDTLPLDSLEKARRIEVSHHHRTGAVEQRWCRQDARLVRQRADMQQCTVCADVVHHRRENIAIDVDPLPVQVYRTLVIPGGTRS